MKTNGRAVLVLAWLCLLLAWSGLVYGVAPTESADGWPARPAELDESSWTSLKEAMAKATQHADLVAADGAAGDWFGWSVALSGDTALVGAPGDDIGNNFNQGSGYVFVRNGTTWVQQAKLVAADGAAGDEFGRSVALSGDTALVGAWFDDIDANQNQGSAYVFSLDEIFENGFEP